MTADLIEHARTVIAAETCIPSRLNSSLCRVHLSSWRPGEDECRGVPDSLDVARDLLALVEAVAALADEYERQRAADARELLAAMRTNRDALEAERDRLAAAVQRVRRWAESVPPARDSDRLPWDHRYQGRWEAAQTVLSALDGPSEGAG